MLHSHYIIIIRLYRPAMEFDAQKLFLPQKQDHTKKSEADCPMSLWAYPKKSILLFDFGAMWVQHGAQRLLHVSSLRVHLQEDGIRVRNM